MTTENDFHSLLDAHPDDHQTRLVFSDWLRERGDERADGYAALGVLRAHPYMGTNYEPATWWGWTSDLNYYVKASKSNRRGDRSRYCDNALYDDWFQLVASGRKLRSPVWIESFSSRREAEDAAARAFARLPESRRAELLSPSLTGAA